MPMIGLTLQNPPNSCSSCFCFFSAVLYTASSGTGKRHVFYQSYMQIYSLSAFRLSVSYFVSYSSARIASAFRISHGCCGSILLDGRMTSFAISLYSPSTFPLA